MAFASSFLAPLLFLSLLSSSPLFCSGGIICEDLPTNVCVYTISNSGKRCVLETMEMEKGVVELQCKTSEVMVEEKKMVNYIETDRCVRACGTDRNVVGISSDALLEPGFTSMLCSSSCFLNCPSIVDLYSKLASGEGVLLNELCKSQRSSARRAMVEVLSSGGGEPAPGPMGFFMDSKFAQAPSPTFA